MNAIVMIASFPRLFYLSASDSVMFVDEDESTFNTLGVGAFAFILIVLLQYRLISTNHMKHDNSSFTRVMDTTPLN